MYEKLFDSVIAQKIALSFKVHVKSIQINILFEGIQAELTLKHIKINYYMH